jgi:hypothetical protein
VPTLHLTLSQTELIVDLNEDGFCLSDVIAICSTGESSKRLDPNSTGEKGIGFKAVFGIADQVQITSGVWSFRFDHPHEDNGIGMIEPIWQRGEQLPKGIHTRFRLRLAFSKADGFEKLCADMRSQHPSAIFALRQLKRLEMKFEVDDDGCRMLSFEKSTDDTRKMMTITAREDGKITEHFYRIFENEVPTEPRPPERSQKASLVTIGLPVSTLIDGSPVIDSTGQFVFAFLPIKRVKELPFLVNADFILTSNRQAIQDNDWNQVLRDATAKTFSKLAKTLVAEDTRMAFEWLAYVPVQSLTDFLEPLSHLIQQELTAQELFYPKAGPPKQPGQLRIPSSDFTHGSKPLFATRKQPWYFLSEKYRSCYHNVLTILGVSELSFDEGFDLVADDLAYWLSDLRNKPLQDEWHVTFLKFVQKGLNLANKACKDKILSMKIIPVLVNDAWEWYAPRPDIFFPHMVHEGSGPDRLVIQIPTNLGFVVVRPDAALDPERREIYRNLGVRDASPHQVCSTAILAMAGNSTSSRADLCRSLELLFWFSYPLSIMDRDRLRARTAGNSGISAITSKLFMRSGEQYHAEGLVCLDKNQQFGEHFLDRIYQDSKVATRSRGAKTWERWLNEDARVRWYPPLCDSSDDNKLHWIFDVVRSRDSTLFLGLIQHYWTPQYRNACHQRPKLEGILRKINVSCLNGRTEEIGKSWFPAKDILEKARLYEVDSRLPILQLPDPAENHSISNWSSLRDLGVRHTLDLSFYRASLALLAATKEAPSVGLERLGLLYRDMAECMTRGDRKTLTTCRSK